MGQKRGRGAAAGAEGGPRWPALGPGREAAVCAQASSGEAGPSPSAASDSPQHCVRSADGGWPGSGRGLPGCSLRFRCECWSCSVCHRGGYYFLGGASHSMDVNPPFKGFWDSLALPEGAGEARGRHEGADHPCSRASGTHTATHGSGGPGRPLPLRPSRMVTEAARQLLHPGPLACPAMAVPLSEAPGRRLETSHPDTAHAGSGGGPSNTAA